MDYGQQSVPGMTGGINDLIRALMGGVKSRPQVASAPVQPPLSLAPPIAVPPPTPPRWGPTAGVPYTGQAMGINGPGPMGPLMMKPPGY